MYVSDSGWDQRRGYMYMLMNVKDPWSVNGCMTEFRFLEGYGCFISLLRLDLICRPLRLLTPVGISYLEDSADLHRMSVKSTLTATYMFISWCLSGQAKVGKGRPLYPVSTHVQSVLVNPIICYCNFFLFCKITNESTITINL